MMGAHVLEQARLHETPKLVARRHDLRLPEARPRALPRGRSLGRLPRGDQRPYGVAKKALLVGAPAYREQSGSTRSSSSRRTSTGRATTSISRASHVIPCADPQDGRRAPTRSRSGATARRRASTCTSTTASKGWFSPRSSTTAPEPVNLGTGVETSIKETRRDRRRGGRVQRGRIHWDTSMPNGRPRRSLDPSRARELFGFSARGAAAGGDRAHGSLVSVRRRRSLLLTRTTPYLSWASSRGHSFPQRSHPWWTRASAPSRLTGRQNNLQPDARRWRERACRATPVQARELSFSSATRCASTVL